MTFGFDFVGPWCTDVTPLQYTMQQLVDMCILVTCDCRQGSGVGTGQQHISFIGLRQVGVTAELLFLGQLEGDRDHTKLSNNVSTDTQLYYSNIPSLAALSLLPFPSFSLPVIFPPLSFSPLSKVHSHPFAVQCIRPFSFLCDEDHAAPLLLLLTLPQFDLCIAHRHHPFLHCNCTHAAAGALQGRGPGGRRLRRKVPWGEAEKVWVVNNRS